MTGGTETFEDADPKLHSLTELVEEDDEMNVIIRERIKYPRRHHSLCTMGKNFIIASGSDVKKDDAAKSVEIYSLDEDRWE